MRHLALLACLLFLTIFVSCTNEPKIKHSQYLQTLNIDTSNINVEQLSKQIANYNAVESRYVGFEGRVSAQYQRFEMLCLKASQDDLLKLMKHANSTVRAYSFWALSRKNYPYIKSILDKNIHDTATIKYTTGDMVSIFPIKNFYLTLLTRNQLDDSCMKLSENDLKLYSERINRGD